MSFPLSPTNGQLTTQNGIKYVYSTATNSWRRSYNNALDQLYIVGTYTSVSTSTGALVVFSGVGIGGNANIGGAVTILSTASSTDIQNNALYVAGGVGIEKQLTVDGTVLFRNSVTFDGTATFVYSTNTVYTDNILILHNPVSTSTWNTNDGKDIGLVFHYYDTQDDFGFLGRANDTGYLEWYGAGVELTTGTFSGSYGTIKAGTLKLVDDTTSTNTASGAITVLGGVGIGGNLNVGGTLTVGPTIDTQVVPALYSNGNAITSYTSPSTSTSATHIVDVIDMAEYRTCRYVVQVVDSGYTPSKVHVSEIMLFHDNNGVSTETYLSEYGIMHNFGSLGSFTATYIANEIRLIFTPNYTPTSLVTKVVRTSISL